MPDFGFWDGAETYRSSLTTVIGGAANTKGAWTQITACSGISVGFAYLNLRSDNTAAKRVQALFDIGIGGAGAEVPVFSNIPYSTGNGIGNGYVSPISFPLSVPSSDRLSVRVQAQTPTSTLVLSLILVGMRFQGPKEVSQWVTLGANEANSRGVDLNTQSTWFEITPSTPMDFKHLLSCVTDENAAGSVAAISIFDVGIGEAGTEVILASYSLRNLYTYDGPTPKITYIPVSVPAGSRLVARWDQTAVNSPSVVLIGGA